mmetsp:Transcript_14214/g.34413  ORF Transcript_14214/g.34413 Transcript_14214/m.34413 type:complete len:223 (+) Transcript_14214:39-707(+)|eukprot:CAMPEP_0180133352 /NCGR_PEP_ID=MMETSP0986-20121125/9492_1 /TAXON_ID=697907 /ORGANISM="non described non described, Strain CCMP2293" /LENGTH=222 /DNA_ID=CAMNT_0022073459 /DNA_START=269 /DNA_END=937 /DNA_ORIENTATION=-
MPGLNLGDLVPNFAATTTEGDIKFHDFIGDGWCIMFSHPADYTPVCTTELGTVEKLSAEFKKRGAKVIALSCNDTDSHKGWIEDIKAAQGLSTFSYPIIADPKRELAVQWGMVDPDEKDAAGLAMTCRAVFIMGPDKKLKLQILYPASTGRNFNEVLRVLDSLQLTANHSVATPANWEDGGDCMVLPSLTDEAAKAKFPKGFKTTEVPSGKPYLRFTPQPNK